MSELLSAFRENAIFILVSLLIFGGILGLAFLSQQKFCHKIRYQSPARFVSFIAMSSALSAVIMLLEIPLFFAPSFYQLDFSEVPVLIASFYLGPVAGVLVEFLKICIKLVLKGTTTAFVGDFANFVIGCSFVLPASILYHGGKSKKTAVLSMSAGTLCMTTFGSLFNAVYLLPKFSQLYGMPLDAIVAMGSAINPAIDSVASLVLLAVVPFNLVKGVLVSTITFLLYKRVEKVLGRLFLK
ncbi:MAG: ECF transporter S component [Eubacteriales bacterium]